MGSGSLEPLSYKQSEISALFQRDPNWFPQRKSKLIERHNFPPPLPGVGHPLWSRAQVDTWFATGGRSYELGQDNREAPAEDFDALIAGRLDAMGGGDEPAAA